VDPETARENRRLVPKIDAETARETRRLFRDVKKTPTPTPSPDPDPPKTKKTKTVIPPPPPPEETGTTPSETTPAPVSSTLASIFDPNVYSIYKKEIERLTLRLVRRAKNLLLAYDFASIDRIAEYSLETDNGARNTDVISTPQVPQSPSTSIITAQDTAIALINEISNKISDNVPLATKLDLFGSNVNGRFTPRKLGISNGVANYDFKFRVDNVSPQIKNIIIRCYEI
jgi:outer membrane biosynthesis protein TonB